MIENEYNNRINIINRRQQPYQKEDNLNKMATQNPKYYYQNAYNIINKNNLSGSNSMNKHNNKMNNIMDNINKMNINYKNMNYSNNKSNTNINNNQNRNMNNQNNNINKALLVIKNEFKRKDERIKLLELKVAELENKINRILKSGNLQSNYNTNITNLINISQKQTGKNFTFSEKYSEEINPEYNRRDSNINKAREINYNRGNNPFRDKEDNHNNNNNYNIQTKSANQYKIKANNINNDLIITNKNNLNDTNMEGSIFTGNSSNFQKHSKNEVKLYLKEVKSKVDPIIFKKFIQNIKLLTNSKDKNGVDRNSIIEKVKILFGEQFKDLFIKFQSILGFNNN